MTTPTISVVVIGRNEGQRLARCLESIAASQTPVLEVIYVDSNSTDQSPALASQMHAQVIPLSAARTTAALGRNAGWRAARGTHILFLDGDTILAPDFLTHAIIPFADPTVAITWGHRREIATHASLYNRVLDLDWIYPPGPTPFCGGDALISREVLDLTGGFDETLIAGEEPELCRRILAAGYRILHLDTPMTGHDLAISRFAQYWRRATRAGHAYAEVSARFRHTPSPFWLAESRRNLTRATILLALAFLTLALTLVLRSPWPLLAAATLFLLLILRTAWKARWKSPQDPTALILYALHSQFQQIPILAGQLRFRLNQRRGTRQALVEYK